ncbi:ATP-dependent DNA ligase [Mycetocola zhujimingii]|uniref:ATP-dependent DNA ligase n=1 Tax=Mycetocola zhujimingii TaxID=2079792 RepID=A0A2U1TBJ3_9MICO|nr:ATP-dependent DNA ligase [Mycetocola zhujimingii]PWC06272.1 ATP-dependent DNA ligase [Mycetocola zhujimingii]
MGRLVYDSTTSINLDDRTLAHLQIVIGAKLRRGESFPFRWKLPDGAGGPPGSLWIAPGISLYFRYDESRLPNINLDWISALTASSNSDAGLRLISEPIAAQDDVRDERVGRL